MRQEGYHVHLFVDYKNRLCFRYTVDCVSRLVKVDAIFEQKKPGRKRTALRDLFFVGNVID